MADDTNRIGMGRIAPIVIDDGRPAGDARPAIVEDGESGPAAVIDEEGDVAGGLPRRAIRNGDGTVTLPLREPVDIQVRGADQRVRTDRFETLTFHRLRGGDMRAVMNASKDAAVVVAIARSTRIREAVMNAAFDRMDAADIADAGEVVSCFLGNGPKTGR